MYTADAKRLTAAGAKKIMTTAIARAQEAGIAVSVAIVDAGGHLLLLERMEGGRFHTVHSATTKAVCAASNKRATGSKGAQGQPTRTASSCGFCEQGIANGEYRIERPSPAGLTRGSIFFGKSSCELDGLPGQARQ